jgi:hypothetical protein
MSEWRTIGVVIVRVRKGQAVGEEDGECRRLGGQWKRERVRAWTGACTVPMVS